jgi:hypothetical protein
MWLAEGWPFIRDRDTCLRSCIQTFAEVLSSWVMQPGLESRHSNLFNTELQQA